MSVLSEPLGISDAALQQYAGLNGRTAEELGYCEGIIEKNTPVPVT